MSDEVQVGYAILAGLCAIISTILRWRKHTREAEQSVLSDHDRVQHIRMTIRSEILDSLVANLLPMRRIYIGLSDEERLRRELELIFNKPQEVQTLSARFCALLELKSYPSKLRRARTVQSLSLTAGILALIGALLPLGGQLVDRPIEFGLVSQIALSVVMVSVTVLAIVTIMKRRLEHRIQSMLEAT